MESQHFPNDEQNTTQIGARLPSDVVERMKALADRERRSLSGQILVALEEHLARQEQSK